MFRWYIKDSKYHKQHIIESPSIYIYGFKNKETYDYKFGMATTIKSMIMIIINYEISKIVVKIKT